MADFDYLEFSRKLSLATYCLYVPTLIFWTVLLIRVLISDDRKKLKSLIVICILMIVNEIACMVMWQLIYTY